MSALERIDPLSRLVGSGDEVATRTSESWVPPEGEFSAPTRPPVVDVKATTSRRRERAKADTGNRIEEKAETTAAGSFPTPHPAETKEGTVPGDTLGELVGIIDRARAFAERWDPPFRSEVFRIALGRLISATAMTMPTTNVPVTGATSGGIRTQAQPSAGLGPTEKLARQLSVDVDAVERAVHFGEGGKISILCRIEGKTRRELQIKYGLVQMYVKEIALATRLVDIDELRAVCVEQGCYEQGNFVGNYRKAQQDGLMREQVAEKGARTRRYMLTQKGMNEAATLLRELVLQ